MYDAVTAVLSELDAILAFKEEQRKRCFCCPNKLVMGHYEILTTATRWICESKSKVFRESSIWRERLIRISKKA